MTPFLDPVSIISIAAVIFGIGLACYALRQVRASMQSRYWPHVQGTILEAKLITTGSSEGGPLYWPSVHYRYRIDDRLFHSNRISFDSPCRRHRGYAQRMVSQYAEDDAVQVYYDPRNPQAAVLTPGFSKGNFYTAILAFVIVIIGVIGVLPEFLYQK